MVGTFNKTGSTVLVHGNYEKKAAPEKKRLCQGAVLPFEKCRRFRSEAVLEEYSYTTLCNSNIEQNEAQQRYETQST